MRDPRLQVPPQPYPVRGAVRSVPAALATDGHLELRARAVHHESRLARCANSAGAKPRTRRLRSRLAASSVSSEAQHAIATAEAEREAQRRANLTFDILALDLRTAGRIERLRIQRSGQQGVI